MHARGSVHAVWCPRSCHPSIERIEQPDTRFVTNLRACRPVEPRGRGTGESLLKVGLFPIFHEEYGMPPNRLQRAERGVEVRTKQVPSKNGDVRVIANAPTF